jgi:hypothetical protein
MVASSLQIVAELQLAAAAISGNLLINARCRVPDERSSA